MKQGIAALVATTALMWAAQAQATDCNFNAVGDPRNGMTFVALQQHPGVSVLSGLGQIRKLARDEKFEVGYDNIKPDEGLLFLIQTTNNPPVIVTASGEPGGKFGLVMSLQRGQQIADADAQRHMCGMLAGIVPGAAGEAIARDARAADNMDTVTAVDAVAFSDELGKEARRVGASTTTASLKDALLGRNARSLGQRDVDARVLPFIAKYLGRRYRIDGQVYTSSRGGLSDTMTVGYLVTPTRGLLRVRADNDMNNSFFTVHCQLASDQAALFATLGSQDWVTLEGVVEDLQLNGITLRECRQAR